MVKIKGAVKIVKQLINPAPTDYMKLLHWSTLILLPRTLDQFYGKFGVLSTNMKSVLLDRL